MSTVRRAMVVIAHPDPMSLNHALARAVAQAWGDLGHSTDFIDLHAIEFDPILSAEEARGRVSTDAMVRGQIDMLLAADLLCVVHPNCWGAPPAMMKGWMDRVFAPNAAYSFAKRSDDGDPPIGLLKGKRALVLNTSNTTAARERACFGDPLERIWRDCLLSYCGFDVVDRRVFRVIATSRAEERASWIRDAVSAATILADRYTGGPPRASQVQGRQESCP